MTVRVSPGAVTRIVIDDPRTRNALGLETLIALADAVTAAAEADGTRVILLSGSNDVFSSGANLKEPVAIDATLGAISSAYDSIALSRIPVVAEVSGYCLGLAVGVVAACDLAIATTSTRFALPEVRIGQVATMAALPLAARLRRADMARLLLVADAFDGVHAEHIGLINEAVQEVELGERVRALTEDLLRGGPEALAECKRLLRSFERVPDDAKKLASDLTRQLAKSHEAREGALASREGRAPAWASSIKHTRNAASAE